MKRILDIVLSSLLLVLLAPVIAVIVLAIRATSSDSVLYWSDRVGRDNRLFRMPKFRTMRASTPQVATHLLKDAGRWLTPLGGLLRTSSLDELPQLWSILRGDMSFVGPRPALFNQHDLVEMRTNCEVHRLTPGLTGWAQINGRDELAVAEKVAFDLDYLQQASISLDLRILLMTITKVVRREGVQGIAPRPQSS